MGQLLGKLLLLLMLTAPAAQADVNEVFADLLGRPERPGTKASYDIRQYETEPLKNGKGKLGLRRHEANATVPLNNLTDRRWRLLLRAGADEIRSAALFPNGRPLPNTIWTVSTGFSYMRTDDENNSYGGSFTVGSNSDQPFAAFRDTIFNANLIFKDAGENDSSWIFFVNMSNSRGFANYFPLPGFAYIFKPRENLRLALGLPFFLVFWSPFENSAFSLSYFPLVNAQAKFSYFIFGPAHVYLQAKYRSENYRLADRNNAQERLFYDEGTAAAGVSMPLEKFVLVDASLGYSFDRKYFLGEDYSARRQTQVLHPEKGGFAALKVTGVF